ncbi:hypothetical protein AB1283_17880 [Bacillus sp. S13(2024)]|uniref:hypothetical protein n=1 Tax=unclassified Bacillus (in: firmicutes) TaxID=185979 RepID=UPI003D23D3A6
MNNEKERIILDISATLTNLNGITEEELKNFPYEILKEIEEKLKETAQKVQDGIDQLKS